MSQNIEWRRKFLALHLLIKLYNLILFEKEKLTRPLSFACFVCEINKNDKNVSRLAFFSQRDLQQTKKNNYYILNDMNMLK